MFGCTVIRGIWRAKSPIFHGGNEKTGTTVLLRRMKFITSSGVEELPYIHGNAIRGYLRRLIFTDLLNKVNYTINLSKKSGRMLYHSLFSGGVLETVEREGWTVNIEIKRKIYDTIIPARLFGFAFGNQMLEGKLKVGFAYPIVKEFTDYIPINCIPIKPTLSIYDVLTHTFQTRKDELREKREKEEQAVQMLIEYECFASGTLFYHEFKLEDPEDLDLSCLARVIELWKKKPFIGGKSSIGFGEIEIDYELNETSKKYLDFLKKNSDVICKTLKELESFVHSK